LPSGMELGIFFMSPITVVLTATLTAVLTTSVSALLTAVLRVRRSQREVELSEIVADRPIFACLTSVNRGSDVIGAGLRVNEYLPPQSQQEMSTRRGEARRARFTCNSPLHESLETDSPRLASLEPNRPNRRLILLASCYVENGHRALRTVVFHVTNHCIRLLSRKVVTEVGHGLPSTGAHSNILNSDVAS
jgi:hypothetical protein